VAVLVPFAQLFVNFPLLGGLDQFQPLCFGVFIEGPKQFLAGHFVPIKFREKAIVRYQAIDIQGTFEIIPHLPLLRSSQNLQIRQLIFLIGDLLEGGGVDFLLFFFPMFLKAENRFEAELKLFH
jgi:hypothetical protein